MPLLTCLCVEMVLPAQGHGQACRGEFQACLNLFLREMNTLTVRISPFLLTVSHFRHTPFTKQCDHDRENVQSSFETHERDTSFKVGQKVRDTS